MQTKKTIAIIGATGNTGTVLAKSLAKGRYRLLLLDKDTEKLSSLSRDITKASPHADVEVIECAKEACWEADMIIAATPYDAVEETAQKIKEVSTGKIVISIAGHQEKNGTGAAEELQKLLPYSKVVKAVYGETSGCRIEGKDEEALEMVADILKTAGLIVK